MPEIPDDQKDRYRRLISDFDAVSVREPSSVPMLEDLGISNVQSVIDPVFLLEKDDWNVIADASDFTPTEDYVLVYGYNRQKDVYAYARRLAKKLGVKVYTIGTAIEDYTLDQDRYFWNASLTLCEPDSQCESRGDKFIPWHCVLYCVQQTIPLLYS